MATEILWAMETSSCKKSSSDFRFSSFESASLPAFSTYDLANSLSAVARCHSARTTSETSVTSCPACASAAIATFLADSTVVSRRRESNAAIFACAAEKITAKPRTSPINSSSESCSSEAAPSSSEAMLKDTETLRSLPIDDSAPKVVPPIPVASTLMVSLSGGAPATGNLEITTDELRLASGEGGKLTGALFPFQADRELKVCRLLLDAGQRKRRRDDAVGVGGAVFGCTLANLVEFLQGRGVPAEKAAILHSIRRHLQPAARALASMQGADASHLANGLAAVRVVKGQRKTLSEGKHTKIDSKYGHPYTVVGTTAAILSVFGYLSEVPNHALHFTRDGSLWKILRCAEETLKTWRPCTVYMSEEQWDSLRAERRALRRACLSCWRDAKVVDDEGRPLSLPRVISAATAAAFPRGVVVDEFSQAKLCEQVVRGLEFDTAESLARPLIVLPLSEIPYVWTTGDREWSESSSWCTVSGASSRASIDSCGSLVKDFQNAF